MQRVGPPEQRVSRAWPGVPKGIRSGRSDETSASLVDHLTALTEAMDLWCSLEIERITQTLDLHVQEEQVYVTNGTETDVTLTFLPQTAQQEFIDAVTMGYTGTDAAIASLISTGVIGYYKLGPQVVNFNVPSISATELNILLTQSSDRVIHLFPTTGDFPAGLKFYGCLTGRVVPSSIPSVERGGVLH